MDLSIRRLLRKFQISGDFADLVEYTAAVVRSVPAAPQVMLDAVIQQDWGRIYQLAEDRLLLDPHWLPILTYIYTLPGDTFIFINRPISSLRSHNLIYHIARAGGVDFVADQIILEPLVARETTTVHAIYALTELPLWCYDDNPIIWRKLRDIFKSNYGTKAGYVNYAAPIIAQIGTRNEDIPILRDFVLNHQAGNWTPITIMEAICIIGGHEAIHALGQIIENANLHTTIEYAAPLFALAVRLHGSQDSEIVTWALQLLQTTANNLPDGEDIHGVYSYRASNNLRQAAAIISHAHLTHYSLPTIQGKIEGRRRFWGRLRQWRRLNLAQH